MAAGTNDGPNSPHSFTVPTSSLSLPVQKLARRGRARSKTDDVWSFLPPGRRGQAAPRPAAALHPNIFDRRPLVPRPPSDQSPSLTMSCGSRQLCEIQTQGAAFLKFRLVELAFHLYLFLKSSPFFCRPREAAFLHYRSEHCTGRCSRPKVPILGQDVEASKRRSSRSKDRRHCRFDSRSIRGSGTWQCLPFPHSSSRRNLPLGTSI